MLTKNFARGVLCIIDGIDVSNRDHKVFAAAGIRREVSNVAFVNRGVWNLDEVSLQCHQNGRPHIQLLDVPSHARDVDQISGVEWALQTKKNACEKILRDVTKCNPHRQTNQACSSDNEQC